MEEYMLPCFFKSYTGLDCIGCGIQRSINFLFHGEFIKALEIFPAIYTTILFFVFIGLHLLDKRREYHKMVIFLAIANASIMIISYVYKMKFLY
ncbi:MAG: DUF2752 domain-containing protein [Flavobacterium sp.]|jgi:hypothetical protein|uniref:DUF2752 domain-containing protein n=1 Tax=Flavobacterium sp. TaxID=239 RepID=UPI000ABE53A9|nr:DUF2752 domain-containing protein [Flavobacterium sp.]